MSKKQTEMNCFYSKFYKELQIFYYSGCETLGLFRMLLLYHTITILTPVTDEPVSFLFLFPS